MLIVSNSIMKGETHKESRLWRALIREAKVRNSPLQLWLLIDQLQAEMAKRNS